MDNQKWSLMESYGRFKTIRRRKRLQKKDRDKQLIQLSIRQKSLYKKKFELPLIPVQEPYQRGWVRTFVLREDVQKSKDADFFQRLLNKINTTEFSSYKRFKIKVKRNGKKTYKTQPQLLPHIFYKDWIANKIVFTEKEKAYFYKHNVWLENWNQYATVYSFDEPWRYVLKIKHNMITHTKMINTDLERELKEIENYTIKNNVRHKMIRLTNCNKNTFKSCQKEKEKYRISFSDQINEYYGM